MNTVHRLLVLAAGAAAAAAGATAPAGCVTDSGVGSVNRPAVIEVYVMGRVDGQALPQLSFGAGAESVTDALAVRDQRITVVVSEALVGVDRFEDDSAQILCDGEPMPFVTEGREQNEWDAEALTLSLIPQYLRTRAVCTIAFADFVTDVDGNQLCAPPNGDPTESCDEGDTSLIQFTVEPFVLTFTSPADSMTDVLPGETSVLLQFRPTAVESDVNLAHLHIADYAGPAAHSTSVTSIGDTQTIVLDVDQGLRPGTDYTVTIDGGDDGLADITGGVLEASELTMSFRTQP